ncbi:hypothetical protein [Bradyrhizobium sp. USDA 3315]
MAIKPLGAFRENRGIRIWTPVSARAAERKEGASRSDPRRSGMVEDLSADRGVPIEPPDHHKVAA